MSIRFNAIAAAALTVGVLGAAIAAEPLQEVTVQATRVVKTTVGKTSTGIPIVDTSVSYGVSYADLNLSSHADVQTLQSRVKKAAEKACTELGKLNPITDTHQSAMDCKKETSNKALAKVDELTASYR